MIWPRPPLGLNKKYSSSNDVKGISTPPEPINKEVLKSEYVHKAGVPGGRWNEEEESVQLQRKQRKEEIHRSSTEYMREEKRNTIGKVAPMVHEERNPYIRQSEAPGFYERKLIEDITVPGGVRPRPTDKEMNEFCSKCMYLSCEVVMDILIEILQEQPRSLKALYVIDKVVGEYENYKDYASQYAREISRISHTPAHTRILQTLLSKLEIDQPATQTADLLLF